MRRILLLLLLGVVSSCSSSSVLANFEPVLVFPQTTLFQFTVGVGTPIAMDKKGGIGFNSGFQFNYVMPWNLSQFHPPTPTTSTPTPSTTTNTTNTTTHARSARQALLANDEDEEDQRPAPLNLDNVYLALEELLDTQGWSDGRECLLRIICELAQLPLVRSHQHGDGQPDGSGGALEEIVHLLLTPSGDELENDAYLEAELLGQSQEDCGLAYPGCLRSPLDSFTEIVAPGFG